MALKFQLTMLTNAEQYCGAAEFYTTSASARAKNVQELTVLHAAPFPALAVPVLYCKQTKITKKTEKVVKASIFVFF
jgi:hypothetical protein